MFILVPCNVARLNSMVAGQAYTVASHAVKTLHTTEKSKSQVSVFSDSRRIKK